MALLQHRLSLNVFAAETYTQKSGFKMRFGCFNFCSKVVLRSYLVAEIVGLIGQNTIF